MLWVGSVYGLYTSVAESSRNLFHSWQMSDLPGCFLVILVVIEHFVVQVVQSVCPVCVCVCVCARTVAVERSYLYI